MSLDCSGNKGNWIALYVFGGLKGATGLVLMIVGIILMAHSPRDCSEITKCYEEKGIPKCAWSDRRLSEVNLTQPLDSDYPHSIMPRVKQLANDILGIDYKAFKKGPLALADNMADKGHQLASARRMAECYSTYTNCDSDMQEMSDGAGNWGTALLVIGLIGGLSGIMSALGAKKKAKVWLGVSMGIDIVMMFTCIAMFMLCGIIAGVMEAICNHIEEEAAKNDKACWEEFIADVCSWADLFGTATIMFLVMFFVELGTTIVDCSTCCCCVPEDAHWSPKFQQGAGAPAVQGAVIGKPVDASGEKQP